MSAEQETSVVQPDEYLTVFDVWERILNKHPEIVKQSAVGYIPQAHGQTVIEEAVVLPRERITWDLDDGERGFYGQGGYQKAIGAQVEIRPYNYDPEIDYSGSGGWFNDGESLNIDPNSERAFIFVDIESSPNKETLELFIKTLKDWGKDWYLLDSGKGSHLIIDHLTSPKDLPRFFGQLIMDVAKELGPIKSKLYGHIGKYLIDNYDDSEKLESWARDTLEKFGHIEDPINLGRLVFPIDMRCIAHHIEKIASNRSDLICLRVGTKHGSVPILKALQVDRQVIVFEKKNDPFDRKQLSLPTL